MDATAGTLHVVATPLGNLDDVSPRVVEILSKAHVVACEDTRRTRRLLQRHGIRPARLISCHKFNEVRTTPVILEALRSGRDVALVSDSGTPAVSDPGASVIQSVLREDLRVSPVPGPSAVAAAVSVSGFVSPGFLFAGFLPARGKPRRELIEKLSSETWPIVLFEAPHRMAATTRDLAASLGDREVTVVREATKIHEEVRRTTLGDLAARLREQAPRGEYTLVVSGRAEKRIVASGPAADSETIRADYERLIADGVERRDALRRVAREMGLTRRQVYAAVSGPEGKASRSGRRGPRT